MLSELNAWGARLGKESLMIIGSLGVRDTRCLELDLFIFYLMQSLAHLGTAHLPVKWSMEACLKH